MIGVDKDILPWTDVPVVAIGPNPYDAESYYVIVGPPVDPPRRRSMLRTLLDHIRGCRFASIDDQIRHAERKPNPYHKGTPPVIVRRFSTIDRTNQ